MKKVIAAIDFSDITSSVIEKAVEVVKAFDGELCIVHSDNSLMDAPGDEIMHAKYMDDLEAITKKVSDQNINVCSAEILGDPCESITREAEKFNADIVIIGSHQHGAFYHLFHYDLKSSLLKTITCPVMVIPHK